MTEQLAIPAENVRSLAVLTLLAEQRAWLTGPEIGLTLDSCILSTRMTIEICAYFGVKAKPVPVSVAAFNADGFRQYSEWHATPEGERGPMGIADPGWCVGVECTDVDTESNVAGGRWTGHLLAEVDGAWLFDFAVDQFSRPAKDMTIEDPLIWPIQADWRTFGVAICRRPDDGVAIVYRSVPAAKGYATAPDWKRSKWWHREITGQLIKRIREGLEP